MVDDYLPMVEKMLLNDIRILERTIDVSPSMFYLFYDEIRYACFFTSEEEKKIEHVYNQGGVV
jgi:hypothetical protein